jgi:FkbM family methyltransferase
LDRERIARRAFGLPILRSLRARRWLWDRRNDVGRLRRSLFERLGSDRYSHPALHDMDRKLAQYLDREGGFFVEAGAYDGFIQSNTYWLERFRGWRGVLVEPIPHLYERARKQRPASHVVNSALVSPDHAEATVRMRYAGLMSLVPGAKGGGELEEEHLLAGDMNGLDDVGQEISVPARTLTDVLNEAGAPAEIDLLSLDVEGFEAGVLQGLDLERYRPSFMLIEMDDIEARRPAIDALIGQAYRAVGLLSPFDLLYERQTARS